MLVMVPSRERPRNVARFAQAAQQTATTADVVFIFDEDDPLLAESIKAAGPWRYVTQPRMITVPKVNHFAMANLDYPVLMFAGDDCIPQTKSWDEQLADAAATGYAYPNGLGRTDIPEHVAIRSDIVEALGWFMLPVLSHYYTDNAWADLGNGAKCITYLSDVVLEHRNPLYRKGPKDHVLRMAELRGDADRAAYQQWHDDGFADDLKTVQQVTAGSKLQG